MAVSPDGKLIVSGGGHKTVKLWDAASGRRIRTLTGHTAQSGLDSGSHRGYFPIVHVGTKELKNRLSHYLRLVRGGETLQITDRGKVVAEIRPVEPLKEDDLEQRLRSLEAEGLVVLGAGRYEDFAPVRLPRGVQASRMILEDRR